MVALGLEEFGALLVGLRLLLLGAVPDVLDREHRHDGEEFLRAPDVDRLYEDLGEGWLERELSHTASQPGKQSFFVELRGGREGVRAGVRARGRA